MAIIALVLLAIAVVAVWRSVEIVNAYEKRALTVFGEYRRLIGPGINFIPPFVSQTYTFDMRTQTIDVRRQEAITRDNSPVTADAKSRGSECRRTLAAGRHIYSSITGGIAPQGGGLVGGERNVAYARLLKYCTDNI